MDTSITGQYDKNGYEIKVGDYVELTFPYTPTLAKVIFDEVEFKAKINSKCESIYNWHQDSIEIDKKTKWLKKNRRNNGSRRT